MTNGENTLYIYYIKFIILLLITTLLWCFSNEANAKQVTKPNRTITLSLSLEPMRDVITKIFQQSGYHVTIDEKWYDILCSGRFENVSVEQIMGRLLQGFNVYSIIDEKNKKINYVIHQADENLTLLSSIAPLERLGSMPNFSPDIGSFPVITQVKDPLFRKKKYDQIETISGIPFAELTSLHQRQIADRKLRERDPGSVDPFSGINSVQLSLLLTDQIKDRIQRDEKLDYLDPMAGLTRRELIFMHASQKEERLKRSNELNDVEPFSGLTYHELASLQRKQVQERHLRENGNSLLGDDL